MSVSVDLTPKTLSAEDLVAFARDPTGHAARITQMQEEHAALEIKRAELAALVGSAEQIEQTRAAAQATLDEAVAKRAAADNALGAAKGQAEQIVADAQAKATQLENETSAHCTALATAAEEANANATMRLAEAAERELAVNAREEAIGALEQAAADAKSIADASKADYERRIEHIKAAQA